MSGEVLLSAYVAPALFAHAHLCGATSLWNARAQAHHNHTYGCHIQLVFILTGCSRLALCSCIVASFGTLRPATPQNESYQSCERSCLQSSWELADAGIYCSRCLPLLFGHQVLVTITASGLCCLGAILLVACPALRLHRNAILTGTLAVRGCCRVVLR